MRILKEQEDKPILTGKLNSFIGILDKKLHYTIDVWCPYCHEYHSHSWDITNRTPMHKSAHCVVESPFNHGGYYVMPEKIS